MTPHMRILTAQGTPNLPEGKTKKEKRIMKDATQES